MWSSAGMATAIGTVAGGGHAKSGTVAIRKAGRFIMMTTEMTTAMTAVTTAATTTATTAATTAATTTATIAVASVCAGTLAAEAASAGHDLRLPMPPRAAYNESRRATRVRSRTRCSPTEGKVPPEAPA